MAKYLTCFLLTVFLTNILAQTKWKDFPYAFPCQEGLCVPYTGYNCPCWHKKYTCRPKNFTCCEDPDFFPMPGKEKFICKNQTAIKP